MRHHTANTRRKKRKINKKGARWWGSLSGADLRLGGICVNPKASESLCNLTWWDEAGPGWRVEGGHVKPRRDRSESPERRVINQDCAMAHDMFGGH